MTRGTAPRRRAPILKALALKALVLALALAAVVLLGGCGSGATQAGSGADASGAATQAPSAQPTAEPSPARTPKTPQPTPSATRTGSTASGGAGKGASGASSGATTVVFVDVGQGDASVIKAGSWTGLIDGGPPGSEPAIEAALAKLGVRRLSAVVVSHMHADHTGGLPRIVSEWRPRTAYMAGTPTSALAGALRGAGTTVVQVRRGATLRFGSARAEVLSPAGLSGDANSDSVVLRLDDAGKSFLFTGDCTGPNEAAVGSICARGPPIDVLKVAHHGSRYSTSTIFLADIRPRVAVICVGPNSYGHPTPATVGRLLAAGSRVYTTWRNGSVTFTVSATGAMSVSFSRSSQAVKKAAAAGRGGGGGAATGAAAGAASSGASGGTIVYVTRTGAG
ncbi:MAG: MBL fold metallo-hydrolase, partial [Actinobacteria bacterium]|nr:MBL fold metallo-hydrolase [Actinomycetota bacterium]